MDVLATVRSLLAKAESTEYDEERDAFNAKAAELIAKYGVDEALSRNARQVRLEVQHKRIDILNPYCLDKLNLLRKIADPMRVRVIRLREKKGSGKVTVHLFGYASDLERVEILFTSLLIQAVHGLLSVDMPWGEDLRVYRRSWLSGFADVIGERVAVLEGQAEQVSGQELVFVGDRAAVASKVSEVYPHISMVKRKIQYSDRGSAAGSLVGRKADLGGVRVSAQDVLKLIQGN